MTARRLSNTCVLICIAIVLFDFIIVFGLGIHVPVVLLKIAGVFFLVGLVARYIDALPTNEHNQAVKKDAEKNDSAS